MAKPSKAVDGVLKMLKHKIDEIVPVTMTAVVVVLYEEYGMDQEQLTEFLTLVQDKWDEVNESPLKAEDYCEQHTGVKLTPPNR